VNPNDVENAVWHFWCCQTGISERRSALLPVGPDGGTHARIYDMFRGATSEDMLAGAQDPSGQFCAAVRGLYFEATGNKQKALEHITAAAADRFARSGGYMHTVAKVHLGILQRGK
jgi:hypothetical protein